MTPKKESEKLFNKNLALWHKENPQAAIYLPYADTAHLAFTHTKKNEINLQHIDEENSFFYHSPAGAITEAEKLLKTVDLENCEVLYVYGIGLGYLYDLLQPWLKKNKKRNLVFLEDDLGVISKFFETDRATKLLKDRQAHLIYFSDLLSEKTALSELYWQFMTLKLEIIALPSYAKMRTERFNQLQHKIAYDATLRYALIDEYLKYGVAFFKNFYGNILNLEGAYLGNKLFGKFKNVPAIICGAGPSLNKQLERLANLKDKAIIFAGGSAMNALNNAGLNPHFGAGIDPNPEQEIRLKQSTGFEVPFFFRNRLLTAALQLVHGPKLYVTGSGGYDIASWIEDKLGIVSEEEELDEGFNIVNFCLAIAYAMGCNPIIFVGMDLAYTDMESYAEGVVKNQRLTKAQLTKVEDLDSTPILREDIYGKPIYTLWKWIAEANWIGEFAKEHADAQIINATEGGIGFPGIANESLQSVAAIHHLHQYDIANWIQGEIQKSALPINREQVVAAIEELKASLERSVEHLNVLIEETNLLCSRIKNDKQVPETVQSGRAALSEIELADEAAYQYVLEIFNAVYSKVLNKELRQNRGPKWRQAAAKCQLNERRLKFLRDVCFANITLINHCM